MSDIELTFVDAPSHDDVESLRDGLTEHAATFIDRPGFLPVAIFARDVVGGVYGFLNWNWLNVSLLWVTERLRGNGLGSRLMLRLEAEAWERGCRRAHLETFSYQARVFYEGHGYRAFASLPEYPPGHERVYLEKRLESGSRG